jgi:hypothetical protein
MPASRLAHVSKSARCRAPSVNWGLKGGPANPVKRGLALEPEQWKWSSYRCYAYDEPRTISYQYDADGNVLSKTSPAPNQTGSSTITTNYSYDEINRLLSKSYTGIGTAGVTYGYDGGTLSGCTTAPPSLTDANPQLYRTSMCDGSGAAAWVHDKMGRVLQDKRTIVGTSNVTNTFVYAYNLDGSLASLQYPSGRTITYTLSTAGRLTAAQDVPTTSTTSRVQLMPPRCNIRIPESNGHLRRALL